jgi:hypothetical protein
MECVACGGAPISERPERTAQGYRGFRCRDCGKQFNERTGGSLNRTQYPPDVTALVVFWRVTALQAEPTRSAGDVPSPRYRIHLCGFRGKAAGDSDPFQPLIPTQTSH